ncbi:MAG: hypothetical protein ACK58N_16740 [Synechocystis sp.]
MGHLENTNFTSIVFYTMNQENWYLSHFLPTHPPLNINDAQYLLWKFYAYGIAISILLLITGGIGFLYLFELGHRFSVLSQKSLAQMGNKKLTSRNVEG